MLDQVKNGHVNTNEKRPRLKKVMNTTVCDEVFRWLRRQKKRISLESLTRIPAILSKYKSFRRPLQPSTKHYIFIHDLSKQTIP